MHSFVLRNLLGGPAIVLALSCIACGGTTEGEDSPTSSGTPEKTTVSNTGNAGEYFHRGPVNLAVDHQRRRFAMTSHVKGSDASFRACGDIEPQGGVTLTAGSELHLTGTNYPSEYGGAIAVTSVAVKSLASEGLVLHVVMKNGTEFDESWKRGLGTECDGACVPDPITCVPR